MLKVLIIEDELPASNRLEQLLAVCETDVKVVAVIDSVRNAVTYLQTNPVLDLIFMDIQLADGLSFNIFKEIEIEKPIIFTTAYNQYALKAFKVNSIDYLLKPIDQKELEAAISKMEKLSSPQNAGNLLEEIEKVVRGKMYKERFLIKEGGGLSFQKTDEIQYFYAESGLTFARNIKNKRINLEETLDHLETILNPTSFFRISRKMILNINAIKAINPYFNNRLVLDLSPSFTEQVIVSRQRVAEFKVWLNS